MSSEPRSGKSRWLYSVFPASMATGPLGAVVSLYLLYLNRGNGLGPIYVSLASAISNGIGIPAALIWGLMIDRLHRRRALIALGNALTSVVLISTYFVGNTEGVIVVYAAVSFMSFASATPLNLLIMETEQKSKWAGAFAKLSMVSSIGNVAGYVLCTVWTDVLPSQLILLFVPMGVLSVTSAVLSLAMIREPSFILERETVARRRPSFFSRLLASPIFFVAIPSMSDFRRAFRGLKSSLTRQVPLFYISTVLFYVSSGLFNTSFVPAMNFFSMPDQQVLGVIMAGMVVQTLAFQGAGKFVGARSLIRTSVQGLMLRGWSYLGIGIAALLLAGPIFVVPALLLYPVAGGIAFAVYYTSANTMMFTTIQSKSAGAALGVYSAVVGLSAMGGSFVSGFISIYSGYYATFILSGIFLFGAVLVVARLPKPSSADESALQ